MRKWFAGKNCHLNRTDSVTTIRPDYHFTVTRINNEDRGLSDEAPVFNTIVVVVTHSLAFESKYLDEVDG